MIELVEPEERKRIAVRTRGAFHYEEAGELVEMPAGTFGIQVPYTSKGGGLAAVCFPHLNRTLAMPKGWIEEETP